MKCRIAAIFLALATGHAAAGGIEVQIFVAPDCPIVNSYAPEIERIQRDYGGKGVSFLLVYPDRDLDEAKVKSHLAEFGLTLPFAIDAGHVRVKRAEASTTPEVVVFDENGVVRYRGRIDDRYGDLGDRRATVSAAYLRDALDALLVGKAPAIAKTAPIGCLIE